MTPQAKQTIIARLDKASKTLERIYGRPGEALLGEIVEALYAVNDARTMLDDTEPTDDRGSIPPGPVPPDPTLTPSLLRLLLDTVPPGWAFTFHRPDDKGY